MTAWHDALRRLSGRTLAGLLYGAACGALVGGVGGRLAMFLLRLTSDDRLRGLETDDGFEIGSFTSGSFFLLAATTMLGAFAGMVYVGIRRWLPTRIRPLAMAAVFGAVGGHAVIKPDGLDFTLLAPLWLAVVLFIALPAAFGALLSWWLERSLVGDRVAPALLLVVPAVLISLTGVGIVVVAALLAGTYAGARWPSVMAAWESPAARWVGRAVLAVGTLAFAVGLAGNARDVLS